MIVAWCRWHPVRTPTPTTEKIRNRENAYGWEEVRRPRAALLFQLVPPAMTDVVVPPAKAMMIVMVNINDGLCR